MNNKTRAFTIKIPKIPPKTYKFTSSSKNNKNYSSQIKTPTGILTFATQASSYENFLKCLLQAILDSDVEQKHNLSSVFRFNAWDVINDHALHSHQLAQVLHQFEDDDFEIGDNLPQHSFRWSDEPFLNFVGEAEKFVETLDKKLKYKLRILYYNETYEAEITDIIDQYNRKLSFDQIKSILNSKSTITLPYKEAAALYIALRDKHVALTIKPFKIKTFSPDIPINGNEQLKLSNKETNI